MFLDDFQACITIRQRSIDTKETERAIHVRDRSIRHVWIGRSKALTTHDDSGAHDTAAGPEAAEDSDDDGALERRSKRRTDRNA